MIYFRLRIATIVLLCIMCPCFIAASFFAYVVSANSGLFYLLMFTLFGVLTTWSWEKEKWQMAFWTSLIGIVVSCYGVLYFSLYGQGKGVGLMKLISSLSDGVGALQELIKAIGVIIGAFCISVSYFRSYWATRKYGIPYRFSKVSLQETIYYLVQVFVFWSLCFGGSIFWISAKDDMVFSAAILSSLFLCIGSVVYWQDVVKPRGSLAKFWFAVFVVGLIVLEVFYVSAALDAKWSLTVAQVYACHFLMMVVITIIWFGVQMFEHDKKVVIVRLEDETYLLAGHYEGNHWVLLNCREGNKNGKVQLYFKRGIFIIQDITRMSLEEKNYEMIVEDVAVGNRRLAIEKMLNTFKLRK